MTTAALYQFYDEQFGVIEREFPGKFMSYMLIQDGYPRVADNGKFLGRDGDLKGLPKGAEQTEKILKLGMQKYPKSFIPQHNGLRPGPKAPNAKKPVCHPRGGRRSAKGCPNRWIMERESQGLKTGYQTVNSTKVQDNIALDKTLQNFEANARGLFLEIYEERVWEGAQLPGPMDAKGSGRTLAEWDQFIRERAKASSTYEFVFDGGQHRVQVISAMRCQDQPMLGTIVIK